MLRHERYTPIVAGQVFDLLTTVSIDGRSNDGHKYWICRCACGGTCRRATNNLRSRGTKSCGCVQSILQTVHGQRGSREYSSWSAAKERCFNASSKDFARYGGRGITMDPEWRQSFEAFLRDMGKRPANTTLDRIDTDGPYAPGNCTWSTATQQARNRRKSVYVEWKGERTHLAEVAADLGITYGAAYQRLNRGKLHDRA